jgi:hypothetical protein
MFAKKRAAQFRGDELGPVCSVCRNDRLTSIRVGNAWDPKNLDQRMVVPNFRFRKGHLRVIETGASVTLR